MWAVYFQLIYHFSNFADHRGHLAQHLSRDVNRLNEPDMLHLNEAGLRVLSVAIKNSIFLLKRELRERGSGGRGSGSGGSGGTGQQQGQSSLSYAGAVRRPQYQWGGGTYRGRYCR